MWLLYCILGDSCTVILYFLVVCITEVPLCHVSDAQVIGILLNLASHIMPSCWLCLVQASYMCARKGLGENCEKPAVTRDVHLNDYYCKMRMWLLVQ